MRTVSVKSAARILDVLELMATLQQGIRVNEIARQLGIPRSSASALVSTLEGRGYIQAAADGYRLAECYRDVGWVGGASATLLRASQPVMNRLVAATGESAFLGVPTSNLSIQYIAKKVSDNPLRYDVGLEFLRPAYCTSIGQVILSSLSDTEFERYLETHDLAAITPRTATDRQAIRKAVELGRKQGYVTIADSNVLGASGVAAPILSGDRVLAGLAVIAPSQRFDPAREQIIQAVVASAREISEALLHRGATPDVVPAQQ
jgi:DNA-binding IclR family transcriptional regulator